MERLADFISDGDLNAEMIHVESEHSAISAAIGSCAAGVRTFTATASQGLALMHEILHVVSGMRLPIVMAVANRALSAPINIWNDQQDSISQRDTGWLQLYVESSQEAFDTTIQAFKIAEKVDLPIMVCLDGYSLSHVYEPVDILEQNGVDAFLPEFKPDVKLDPDNPVTLGPIGFPTEYMEVKKDQQDAILNSIKTVKEVHDQFKKDFKRSYGDGLIEQYQCNDADDIIIAMGTACGTARVAVDEMRKEGKKAGLLKLRCFRPFPVEALQKALKGKKGVAVLDRDVSFGYEGAVASEVKAAICDMENKPKVKSYIAGLGGRDVTVERIKLAIEKLYSQDDNWLF